MNDAPQLHATCSCGASLTTVTWSTMARQWMDRHAACAAAWRDALARTALAPAPAPVRPSVVSIVVDVLDEHHALLDYSGNFTGCACGDHASRENFHRHVGAEIIAALLDSERER